MYVKSISAPNLSSFVDDVLTEIQSNQTDKLLTKLHKIAWGKKVVSGLTLFEELVSSNNHILVCNAMNFINEVHIIENALLISKEPILSTLKKHLFQTFLNHYIQNDDIDTLEKIMDKKDYSLVFSYALKNKSERIASFLCNLIPVDTIFQEMTQDEFEFLIHIYPLIINKKDRFGNTILHFTVSHNMIQATRFLLDKNMNPNQKNAWNITPLNEAIRLELHEVASILRDHGAFLFSENDSKQSIIGSRSDFFNILKFFMDVVPQFFPNIKGALFFHSVQCNQNLYCCSLKYYQKAYNDFVERMNPFIFESSFFCLKNINPISDPIFKPFLHEYNLKNISSFPVYAGITFLGVLVLFSDNDITTYIDRYFFTKLFERNFVKLFHDYPQAISTFKKWDEFRSYEKDIYSRLQTFESKQFIKPLIEVCQLYEFISNQQLQFIIDDFKKTHIPVGKARDTLDFLSIVDTSIILPHESFLLKKFTTWLDLQIEFPFNYTPKPKSPLTSFDLYEIIGNHHPNRPTVDLINKISVNNWKENLIQILLNISNFFPESCSQLRKSVVIGQESFSHYRLFIPPHEINRAIEIIMTKIRNFSTVKAIFIIYKSLLEYIHPFVDANGRIVRTCMTLILRHHGINTCLTTDHKILKWDSYLKLINSSH